MARRAAAYLRNSKDPGTKAEHLARLMTSVHADGQDGNSILYDDWNRSGDRAKLGKRTGWTALCQAIEADQIEVVFMNDLDRGGRSQEEWLRFRRVAVEHKVRVVAGGIDWSAPTRRLEFSIKTMVAEEELEADRRRSAGTMRMRVARKDALGTPPYGYRFVKRETKRDRVAMELDPDEPLEPVLAAVRETRGNISAACKLLNSRGVLTRSEKKRHDLERETGTTIAADGREAWNGRTLKRIVTKAGEGRLLRAAPAIMTARGRLALPHPLARLVVCHCSKPNGSRRFLSVVRTNQELVCPAGHKLGVAVHGRYTVRMRFIYEALRTETALAAAAILTYERPDAQDTSRERADIERKLAALDARLEVGRVTPDDYKTRARALQAEVARLELADEDVIMLNPSFGPLVDWNADPVALGDALRRVFTEVRLDAAMQPAVIWRHQEWRT